MERPEIYRTSLAGRTSAPGSLRNGRFRPTARAIRQTLTVRGPRNGKRGEPRPPVYRPECRARHLTGTPASPCAALARNTYVYIFGMEPRGRVAQIWNVRGCHGRAPSPSSSRPLCDLAPRVQVFPATRGGREQKNGSASAPGKGRVKSSSKTIPQPPFQKRFYTKSLLDGCWQDAPRDVQGLASRPVRRRKSGRPYTARRRWFPVSDHWGFGPFRFPTCQYPEAFDTCRQLTTELTPGRARNFTPRTTKKIKKNAYFKRLKRFLWPL